MSRPIPFTFNAMVLLPLLRSIPTSAAASVVATLLAMTGLDFGLLGLGHPETAADDLVAWIMSFSVAVPGCWAVYLLMNFWTWLNSFLAHRRRTRL
jgi:ABC-type dipeptide/oligopeptide/nickel transport system permease component